MKRTSLDTYDKLPEAMTNYLQHYGWHFNRKMCEFAISQMNHDDEKVVMMPKDKIDQFLKLYSISLKNNVLYDYVYVYYMGKTDFLGKSIVDEFHLAQYIKDVIDDEDGYDGIVFNRWYADMCKKGIPIDWEEML